MDASHHLMPSLHHAAANNDLAALQTLLAQGIPAAAANTMGQTALMHAASAEIAAALLAAGCPHNLRDSFGYTALDHALDHGHRDVVATLVSNGVDLETRDPYGNTTLLRYCRSDTIQPAMVEQLITLGADPQARLANGGTALHVAVQLWSGERHYRLGHTVRILIAAGIDVNAQDDQGNTPLHWATGEEGGELEAIRALLDCGANINARNHNGYTPLMNAASGVHRGRIMAQLLLTAGADATLTANDGRTAHDCALAAVHIWEQIVSEPPDLSMLDDTPAKRAARAAQHRLMLREQRAALMLFNPHTILPPEQSPEVPSPIFLGYRTYPLPVRPADWGQRPETDHITNIGSIGCMSGFILADSDNASPEGFYATAEIARQSANSNAPEGDMFAYQAIPLLFDESGIPRPLAPNELTAGTLPPAPDLTVCERLGYDIHEHQRGIFGGCSPLSCNDMASRYSVAVNQFCLAETLSAAYDLAIDFGVGQPEPGPYLIIEVWRKH